MKRAKVLAEKSMYFSNMNKYFQDIDSIEMLMNSLTVTDIGLEVYKDVGEKKTLNNLADRWYISIPIKGCSPCVDSTLAILKKYKCFKDIFVLVDSDNIKEYNFFAKINEVNFTSYAYTVNEKGFFFNENKYPCLFYLEMIT